MVIHGLNFVPRKMTDFTNTNAAFMEYECGNAMLSTMSNLGVPKNGLDPSWPSNNGDDDNNLYRNSIRTGGTDFQTKPMFPCGGFLNWGIPKLPWDSILKYALTWMIWVP